jgi:glycosyltransferase involved in cell wall biosynthesis
VLFYSSVSDPVLFSRTGFYRVDIQALQNSGNTVTTSNRYRDALCFWKYDVLFAYFWKKTLIPALIARCLGKRVVITGGADELDAGFNASAKSRLVHSILFYLCHLICHVALIQSHSDLKNMRRIVGNSNKLQYSPLPLPQEVMPLPTGDRKPRFVSIAWMSTEANVLRKGIDRAIELLAEVRKHRPEFELHVLGTEGPGSLFLRKKAQELGQEGAVTFLGAVSEEQKVQSLQQAQFYLQLSQYEGFGLAVLEAMVCGSVVAHSNRGGLADTAGTDGIVLPLELPTQTMAARICEVAGNTTAFQNLQQAAHAKVATFSMERRTQEIAAALFSQ